MTVCAFRTIILQDSFYHQHFWKESSEILDILCRDNHKYKVASEITTFVLVWPVVPLV